MEADFSGYATKAGLRCSDGLTIMPNAFEHQDKMRVPLVWQHGHSETNNILGHAILENRKDGVYAYGYFNDTDAGKSARTLVQHGDINALSIFANNLVKKSKNVLHGAIREVSLVLAGANPGAFIDNVRLEHSDGTIDELEDEAVIYTGLTLEHASTKEEDNVAEKDENSNSSENNTNDDSSSGKTVNDVYESMTEEQKNVVHYMVGAALDSDGSDNEDAEHSDQDQEGDEMTHNVFESGSATQEDHTLTHDQLMSVAEDAKRRGSLKEALLAHAQEYGVTNIEALFPEAKLVNGQQPEWLTRKLEWVDGVLNGTRKLPFSRIKSASADLTHEEARAKGYIKGSMKKEQFFAVAARETTPKTVYKKQKLDRDDIIDITDFDIVAWIWQEMRFMLREEIARAILVGDGRAVDDPDKIDETKIRPIAKDDEFYTHKVAVPADVEGEALIEAVLRSRKFYKGSGNPVMYTTEDTVTDLLLLKDKMGRRLYPTEAELKSALRVSDVVAVEIMEDYTDDEGNELACLLVNMSDYSVGTDKGGEITTFDDFDIDYNQYKYLIEGRMSGALTQHKRAVAVWRSLPATGGESEPEDLEAQNQEV